jgi:DNA-directed RNA polymerase subunit RPC12/RpoP
MPEMEHARLTCPQCGGEARAGEEHAFAACPWCGSRLFLDRGRAVAHEVLLPEVGRAHLAARLGRWLSGRETLGRPRLVATRLLLFPLWVIPATEGRAARIAVAAPLLEEPPGGLGLPAGDRKAFRADAVPGAELVPATVHLESLLQRGAEPPKGARLVHVPYWEVRFRIGSQDHRVWIDAVTGGVVPLSEPQSAERRLDSAYTLLLAVTFVALLAGFLLLFQGGGRSAIGLGLLALSGPPAMAAARRLIARLEGPAAAP